MSIGPCLLYFYFFQMSSPPAYSRMANPQMANPQMANPPAYSRVPMKHAERVTQTQVQPASRSPSRDVADRVGQKLLGLTKGTPNPVI